MLFEFLMEFFIGSSNLTSLNYVLQKFLKTKTIQGH